MRGRGPAAGHLERHRLRDPQLVDGGLPLCAEEERLAAAEPTILLAVRVEVERRVEGGARAVDEQHNTLMDESKDADAKAAPARMAWIKANLTPFPVKAAPNCWSSIQPLPATSLTILKNTRAGSSSSKGWSVVLTMVGGGGGGGGGGARSTQVTSTAFDFP